MEDNKNAKQTEVEDFESLEAFYVARINRARYAWHEAVLGLAALYKGHKKEALAAQQMNKLLAAADDAEEAASILLNCGVFYENAHDFESAAESYRQGIRYEPSNADTAYFLNNNLGYSLVQLGRYAEAEPYCAAAISIQSGRHNAHKNLGLSLQGQGRYPEAALCFVEAVKRCPEDPRALRHLEELVDSHPAELEPVENLAGLLEGCRQAVETWRKGPGF